MDEGGRLPVTRGADVDTSEREFQGLALQMPLIHRPNLASHQSSSLPSTPYQHPRKLSFDSHTTSPTKRAVENTSPRSTHSESDSTFRPSRKVPFLSGCKYETGMAFSRRRIPYSVGGDKLERASIMPSKYLNAKDEGKLGADMKALYSRLLPSEESEERRTRFLLKLENILNQQWPGNDIKVHVFGSSGNMLCTSDSDVDICITTPMKVLERVCLLAKALAEHGMERVVCVPNAKVPIVKIWDPELQLACDMNVNNTLALENTRMIKTYVEVDERVRPLAMIVKYWTKQRILNDAALGGTLSSYTWICMIISFLQTRNPPILPSLHRRPHQCSMNPDGKISAFADDIVALRGYGRENKESISELLFHFYRRYAHEIDYEKSVISIREGQLISKEAKKWHLMQNNRLCVEEPFNTERNLGNTADDISFRGVHLELRRAFDLIAEANLDGCCEPYVFPETAEKIWEKPPPQPRPVLSRSASQSGRSGKAGGANNRGGRHQNQSRNGPSNRRASSAAFYKMTGPQNGLNGTPKQEYLEEQFPQLQIHHQLFNRYQWLQAQEAQLRLVLHQRAHQQLQQQQQQMQQVTPQQASLDGLHQRGTIDQAPLSAPLRNMPLYYPMYTVPPLTNATNSRPQPNAHTNPSSPSMTPVPVAQPELRRSLHRGAPPNSPAQAAMRSHSQPARPPPFILNQIYQASAMGNMPPEIYQQGHYRHLPLGDPYQQPMPPLTGGSQLESLIIDSPVDDTIPKEYVGYYVHESPPPRSDPRVPHIASIPLYSDLAHRTRGMSPNLNRNNHVSRSSSPSNPSQHRERSLSFYSAASTPSTSQAGKGPSANTGSRRSGPIIVDGSSEASASDYSTPPEFLCFPEALSEAASLSDDQPIDTPVTASVTPSQEPPDAFDLDSDAAAGHISSFSGIPQFGDFPRMRLAQSTASLVSKVSDTITTQDVGTERLLDQTGPVDHLSRGLGIAYDEGSMNSRPISQPTPQEQLANNHKTESKARMPAEKLDLRHDKPLLPVPLLSPVREVRTPSPTTSRKEEGLLGLQRKVWHGKSNSLSGKESMASPMLATSAGKQKEIEPLGQKTNGQPINGILATSLPAQASGWQQPGKKAKKSKAKTNSMNGPGSTLNETLLGSTSEKKGG